jgi:hypothetical protein
MHGAERTEHFSDPPALCTTRRLRVPPGHSARLHYDIGRTEYPACTDPLVFSGQQMMRSSTLRAGKKAHLLPVRCVITQFERTLLDHSSYLKRSFLNKVNVVYNSEQTLRNSLLGTG